MESPLSWSESVPSAGLLPDNALSNGTKLDTTKPFFPFGQQPQPGIAFYFSCDEIFAKPGASVEIGFVRTDTPQDKLDADTTTPLSHEVAWEYWNGTDWFSLAITTDQTTPPDGTSSPEDLNGTGSVFFIVPKDFVQNKVNGTNAFWVRVRLVGGGYGFSATVSVTNSTNTFTYVVTQPPALSAFRLGYSWQNGPVFAEHVVTWNDFQYEDHTDESQWPSNGYAIFKPVSDITPAFYVGFDKQLPVDDLGFYFDFVEQPGDTSGSALLWEYWNGGDWVEVAATDETQNLRLPGIVSLIGEDDSVALARFDAPYFWLRVRLKEDGPPGEPTLNAIYQNAVWASQQRTVTASALGTSSGQASQVLSVNQIPLLSGERIEVQELSGLSANVEWRILAAELAGGDLSVVDAIEKLLGQEGTQTDFTYGDLRLVRDRNKKVSEAWVRWNSKPNFYTSYAASRDYVPDRAIGRLYFGDGVRGRIPPAGSAVVAALFRTGGGSTGNVAIRTITQMLGAVPGVQSATNIREAEGGSDGETLVEFGQRAPATLRTRGRALTPFDYETLAREASSAVGAAHALATQDADGRPRPGWVTLHILPKSLDAQPMPSFGLRDEVRRYIEDRAVAAITALNRISVVAPEYVPIDVRATVAPLVASEAGDVELAVKVALETFLHPLAGGPRGEGWPPGRTVHLSDLGTALARVPGLDYVEELALYKQGALQTDVVSIGPGQTVAAGQIRINVKVAIE
jgi:uncharacterized phage protein gp47/JayE